MSRTMSREKEVGLSHGSWDQAITDARTLLRKVEEKAVRLRVAISSFEQSKKDGEPYAIESPR